MFLADISPGGGQLLQGWQWLMRMPAADLAQIGARLLLCWQWLVDNPVQLFGTVTGIAGALLLALRCRFSAWAWPTWIASNIAWIYFALGVSEPIYGQIAQNLVFAVINVLGTWRWLYRGAPRVSPAN